MAAQLGILVTCQSEGFKMELIIEELGDPNIENIGRRDGQFVIDSQLVLHAENNQIRYTVREQPLTKKQYDQGNVDYSTYINDPDKAVFLAYADGSVAGQIVLFKNWNKYAYIEYIAVDQTFRRLGIGQALIEQAKRWAQDQQLPGLMLETQNNNVRACKFYEDCGFQIGGFDNYLYKG